MTAFLSDQFAEAINPKTGLPCGNKMKEAYLNKKDLYAMIAMSAFDNRYEDNLEFWPEGTEIEIDGQKIICGNKTHKNPSGKERRSVGKVLNLAATYGMSGATAGARLGKSREDGEALLDNFFSGFPNVKLAIDYSKEFLKTNGYVEDFYGRRRHLPEISAPPYAVSYVNPEEEMSQVFNPFIGCENRDYNTPLKQKWIDKVRQKVQASQDWRRKKAAEDNKPFVENDEMSNAAFEKLAAEALKEGILLTANTGRRAQAERQCFNARIQGGAATLTKLAMVDISRDKELNDYHAQLIIPVHDELLVECPEFYADKVEVRLPDVMTGAAKGGGINIPQSCDPYNVTRWYAEEMAASITDTFKKLMDSGLSKEAALDKIYADHCEIPQSAILDVVEGRTPDEVIF